MTNFIQVTDHHNVSFSFLVKANELKEKDFICDCEHYPCDYPNANIIGYRDLGLD